MKTEKNGKRAIVGNGVTCAGERARGSEFEMWRQESGRRAHRPTTRPMWCAPRPVPE